MMVQYIYCTCTTKLTQALMSLNFFCKEGEPGTRLSLIYDTVLLRRYNVYTCTTKLTQALMSLKKRESLEQGYDTVLLRWYNIYTQSLHKHSSAHLTISGAVPGFLCSFFFWFSRYSLNGACMYGPMYGILLSGEKKRNRAYAACTIGMMCIYFLTLSSPLPTPRGVR